MLNKPTNQPQSSHSLSNLKIGAVESLTGGLFASAVVAVPGASQYFAGALVTYSSKLKNKFGIPTSNGAIQVQVAKDMAHQGRNILGVDICVSFTGNAGPDTQDNTAVGDVFIAIDNGTDNVVFELKLTGSRNHIRRQCVEFAAQKLKIPVDFNNS